MTLQNDRFLIFSQLTRLPISVLFHLFNLLHMLDDRGMVNVKFFGNFFLLVRGSASVMALSWSLSASGGQPLHCSSSRFSFPS